MKKTLIALTIAAACFFAPACKGKSSKQNSDIAVPEKVQTAFDTKYYDAKDVEWETAHEKDMATYKAKFIVGNKKVKAEFTLDGQLVKEEQN